MPADQVFEIGDVGHQRTSELVLHTALGQCRRQQVGDGREPRRLFMPRRQVGKLGLRYRSGLIEDRQDLVAPIQERGPIEIAERFQVAAAARLALGNGHEQIVTNHVAQRSIQAPCLVFTPLAQPSGHLQTPTAQLVQARQPPPAVEVCTLRDRFDEVSHLRFGPGRSIQFGQTTIKMIGQLKQVPDVVEGIIELSRGQRPVPPVRACLAACQAHAQHLADQVDKG